MPVPFTFFFKNDRNAIPPFEIECLEDERSARYRAVVLLQERRQYDAIEVAAETGSFTVERRA